MKPYEKPGNTPNRTPVWERARGRWGEIYKAIAPELSDALAKPGRHVTCPVHGGKHKDAFRLFKDFHEEGAGVCNTCGQFGSGISLLAWLHKCTNAQAATDVDAYLSGDDVDVRPVAQRHYPVEDESKKDDFKIQCLVETWEAAVTLDHESTDPAWRYLERRGLTPLDGPLDDVRFHPNLGCWHEGKLLGRFPALVSLIRQPDGDVLSVHRIYLTPEGHKANVPAPKKAMPAPSFLSWKGASIRLDNATGPILHAGEGVETSLAVRNLVASVGEPTWAGISGSILSGFTPPVQTRVVCFWADRDPTTAQGKTPGMDAVNKAVLALKERGIHGIVMLPPPIKRPEETVDWADVVLRYGVDAVREWPAFKQMRKAVLRASQSRPWRKFGNDR